MDKTFDWPAFSTANRHRSESPQGFNHPLASWSHADWCVAVIGEVGEAANVLKKLNRVRDGITGNDRTPRELHEDFADEIADAFIYLDLLAQALGSSASHCFAEQARRQESLMISTLSDDPNTLMLGLTWAAGGIAWGIARSEDNVSPPPGVFIGIALVYLESLAARFDIDLGAAVISKFMRTSAKIGYEAPEGGGA